MMDDLNEIDKLYENYKIEQQFLAEQNDRKKNRFIQEIESSGENYINDIEKKFIEQEKEKKELIYKILNLKNKEFNDYDNLNDLSLYELKSIYSKILETKKS